jgi:NAD(P)H dehydrogenase (quinone)
MSKILVLYYSAHGHIEMMAEAIADGARSVPGTAVDIKRVPETLSAEAAKGVDSTDDLKAPYATIDDLPNYDGIIFGTRTHMGHMAPQMRHFLDQAGDLWKRGALVGKVGSVFASAANQHGGHEITSFHTILFHLGFVVVGMPYLEQRMIEMGHIGPGSPYGATTLAGGDGIREPTATELALARFQGLHVAEIASKLAA